eukprot:GILJ01003951.1.p1 GENE.GILJ01003951.1~~GILJ01003951.1.p1  ORF type:complete len:572 (-),score=52.66 GILJ01003951.1:451-2124(-)
MEQTEVFVCTAGCCRTKVYEPYLQVEDESNVNPLPPPTDPLVQSFLTDLYQLSMAYAYWQNKRHEDPAVFDLYFRTCPFDGEFAVFAGLEEALRYITHFKITKEHVDYLRSIMPIEDEEFYFWLQTLDCSAVRICAVQEGTIVFGKEPLVRVEGPLAVCQLLETTLLNLLNFPTLVATNAARMRVVAGPDKFLFEFGLRRAQGPNGALSASRYSYLGGFDGTSNVLSGMMFGIPVKGTHAHSFISSFTCLEDLQTRMLHGVDFVAVVLRYLHQLPWPAGNEGELAAFIAFAQSFPAHCLALVDTYDTLRSGVPNYLAVALALRELGYKPIGIRLDSGDLAYLSKAARDMFHTVSKLFGVDLDRLKIVASNDINEAVLTALNEQTHEIDIFGIGTHLVTCQSQPALGMVYKLVSIRGTPRIKLSQEVNKVTIPGCKELYRLCSKDGRPILDLMIRTGEPIPQPNERLLCRHPFEAQKRAYVNAASVVPLLQLVWDGVLTRTLPSLDQCRHHCRSQLALLRQDHLRLINPTPYKVSVSDNLFQFIHHLWQKEAPVVELS